MATRTRPLGTYTLVDAFPVVKVPRRAVTVALRRDSLLTLLVVVPEGDTRRVARLLQCRLRVHRLVRLTAVNRGATSTPTHAHTRQRHQSSHTGCNTVVQQPQPNFAPKNPPMQHSSKRQRLQTHARSSGRHPPLAIPSCGHNAANWSDHVFCRRAGVGADARRQARADVFSVAAADAVIAQCER